MEELGPFFYAPFNRAFDVAEFFSSMLFSTVEFALVAGGIFDLRLPIDPETTWDTPIMLPLAPPELCGPGIVSCAVVADE